MGIRHIAFAGSRLPVAFPEEFSESIAFLFSDLPREGGGPLLPPVRILPDPQSGGFILQSGEKRRYLGQNGAAAARAVLEEAVFLFADQAAGGIALHAAAVSGGAKAVWLPGETGAGKSLLTAWLISRGFTYLTDELVYLPLEGTGFSAFAKPINVKAAGWDALGSLVSIDEHSRAILRDPWGVLIPFRLLNAALPDIAPELALILFPEFRPGAEFRVEALSPARASALLMGCNVNGRNLQDHGFSRIAETARTVSSFRISYGGFDELSGALEPLMEAVLASKQS